MEFPIQRVTYLFFFLVVVVLSCVLFDDIHILSRVRVFAPAETPVFCFFGVCLRQRVCVRPEVAVNVQHNVFTVAILAQGTNRGDALCAALFTNRITSNPSPCIFLSQHI